MTARLDSPPHVARARIDAIARAAKDLSIRTNGDPAECIFELVCAAILISMQARPMKPPADMISEISHSAATTVENWFADELRQMRKGDA